MASFLELLAREARGHIAEQSRARCRSKSDTSDFIFLGDATFKYIHVCHESLFDYIFCLLSLPFSCSFSRPLAHLLHSHHAPLTYTQFTPMTQSRINSPHGPFLHTNWRWAGSGHVRASLCNANTRVYSFLDNRNGKRTQRGTEV